jgi:hypothetical protein
VKRGHNRSVGIFDVIQQRSVCRSCKFKFGNISLTCNESST